MSTSAGWLSAPDRVRLAGVELRGLPGAETQGSGLDVLGDVGEQLAVGVVAEGADAPGTEHVGRGDGGHGRGGAEVEGDHPAVAVQGAPEGEQVTARGVDDDAKGPDVPGVYGAVVEHFVGAALSDEAGVAGATRASHRPAPGPRPHPDYLARVLNTLDDQRRQPREQSSQALSHQL